MQSSFRRVPRLLQGGVVLSFFLGLIGTLPAEIPLPQVGRLQSSPVLRHLKPNPVSWAPGSPAERTLSQMYVPEGFRVSLVVAEPALHQPVAFAFDDRGRIWVAEALSYPQRREPGQGQDRILIFADQDGDGTFETRKVFAEGLNLVSGLEVGFGGVWVGAAPELLFLADKDGDDRADGPPEVLMEGFGFQDTHECLNSFMWGPDGWLYGNQGVFNFSRIGKPGSADSDRVELRAGVWRFHPLRREFEVFAEGGSNQWGLDYDEEGQIFMTHCRSYWGRGGTTHVIQGGQFWNQANANYAPFIVADPPEAFPDFRNYLLASARYDHGAGGAGAQGSDAIYGGHSHVGTMIYLGDNWPREFRGRLFTHNLHGHQINQQVSKREGSGFNTVHAGQDQLFCSDPSYVALDLQYGPDGAVYSIDWYDPQHCHNPNTERWDRSNGRIYRMEHMAGFRPVKVNLGSQDDDSLVELLRNENAWYGRTASRLLQERSGRRRLHANVRAKLVRMAREAETAVLRLKALWVLHAVGELDDDGSLKALGDSDESVRGWAVQLACERRAPSQAVVEVMTRLASVDPSPRVRLSIASAVPRLPESAAWRCLEGLVSHAEDAADRNLPLLIWQGLARRMPGKLEQALALAERSRLPLVADWVLWYAAKLDARGLDAALGAVRKAEDTLLTRRLAGLELALETRAGVGMPAGWSAVSGRLLKHSNAEVRRAAERLSAVFGDPSAFGTLRTALAATTGPMADRQHAFNVLSRAGDRASLPLFLGLLEDPAFRKPALRVLGLFDDPAVSRALIERLSAWPPEEKMTALQTLASRVSFGMPLLDAIAEGRIKRDTLNAYHIRQLSLLRSPEIDRRVSAQWGALKQSPADRAAQIERLMKVFQEAPLWAYDAREGRAHFQKLCISCHVLKGEGTRIGPDLTGAGANGVRYFLENILDPNAVIGSDFQMSEIETRQGRVLSGVVVLDAPETVVLRTATEQLTVAKADIARRGTSAVSLMPEGLLESLNSREQIELLKFLTSN